MTDATLKKIFVVCLFILGCTQVRADVITQMVFSDRDRLVLSLMELAFEKTGYDQKIKGSDEYYADQRLIEEIQNGTVDVMWAGASQAVQAELRAVKIPVFKGLLGHRVMIIEKNNLNKFAGIDDLASLKRVTAGLGRYWGDTQILENSGITVIKTIKAESLFPMLDGGRYDYLPLAVHEAWEVVESKPEFNLMVEDNVLIVYPLPMYLYVSKKNYALYNALLDGFEAAIADGSYDELFYNSKLISQALRVSKISQRKMIKLPNPLLPNDVPLDRPELWLNIHDY